MKIRSKSRQRKSLAIRARASVNPLRIDPTRTATLRRLFTQDIRRRMRRLKLDLHTFLVVEDELGLAKRKPPTINAFCPTGEGGGVDPTCSPGGSSVFSPEGANEGLSFLLSPQSEFLYASKEIKTVLPSGNELYKDRHGSYRFVKVIGGDRVAAIQVVSRDGKSGHIANAYVLPQYRRLGYGRELLADVKKRFKTVSSSQDLSPQGEAWSKSVGLTKLPVANAGLYAFNTDPQKVAAFKTWLQGRFKELFPTQNDPWRRYVEAGFKQGAGRAFEDVNKAKRLGGDKQLDFYNGTKDQFLRSSFAQPVAIDKVQLLAGRTLDELDNVTTDMSNRMTRVLTDGLVKGESPREVADALADEVDIGAARAETIARTETIRAHAEGQLHALEEMGVEEVGVAVEWSVAGGPRWSDLSPKERRLVTHVCKLCEPMEGVVLKLAEAKGMIPRHPNCRCAWIPANVGEDDEGQKDTKKAIDAAMEDSELEITVDKDRPESVLGNVFCPTGEGGGVDPSCSPNEWSREQVIKHIMNTNPPEQVRKGMSDGEWADRYLSEETGGYVLADVHPKSLNSPTELGEPEKVIPFSKMGASTQPPVVVDSNRKIQARWGGGKLDQAYGIQPHTLVDGKHRVAAALLRGDKTIKAIVPKERLEEVLKTSHAVELEEFARQYAADKGHVILSVGGGRVRAKTKEGYERDWGATDLERIASKMGHKFKFASGRTDEPN